MALLGGIGALLAQARQARGWSWTCPFCGQVFTSPAAAQVHVRVEHRQRPLIAEYARWVVESRVRELEAKTKTAALPLAGFVESALPTAAVVEFRDRRGYRTTARVARAPSGAWFWEIKTFEPSGVKTQRSEAPLTRDQAVREMLERVRELSGL